MGLTWAGGEPRLRIRAAASQASKLVPLTGARLRYQAVPDGAPRCLGHTNRSDGDAVYVDCDKPPVEGRQCERCRTVDNVLAASMHQAHRLGRGAVDGRIAKHLDQPHRLYLAVFPDGSLKVGTSAGAVGGHRLLEQGAWLARYVALATDGFAVREIEDLVTETMGVQQAVTVARKIEGLVSPRPTSELDDVLDRAQAQTTELIEAMADPRIEPTSEPWSNPLVGDPLVKRVVRYPAALDRGTHDLTACGVVGRVVIVERPGFDERFAIDVGQLFGVQIDLGDHEADEVAVQAALF